MAKPLLLAAAIIVLIVLCCTVTPRSSAWCEDHGGRMENPPGTDSPYCVGIKP